MRGDCKKNAAFYVCKNPSSSSTVGGLPGPCQLPSVCVTNRNGSSLDGQAAVIDEDKWNAFLSCTRAREAGGSGNSPAGSTVFQQKSFCKLFTPLVAMSFFNLDL